MAQNKSADYKQGRIAQIKVVIRGNTYRDKKILIITSIIECIFTFISLISDVQDKNDN